MKKLTTLLIAALIFLSAMVFPSFAADTAGKNITPETAVTIGMEDYTDCLPTRDSVRWYKLENKADGDVVVYLSNTDGIKNVWGVNLYDSTGTKEIGYYHNYVGETYNISYENLPAGTYYLKFIIGSTYEAQSYENLNYTIRARTVADVNIAPADGAPHIYTKAGEAMFVIDNRVYTKRNDGTTVVAKGYDYNGDPYIMLIGLTEADLDYGMSSSEFTNVPMRYKFVYEDDETYHYLIMNLYSRELKTDLYVCNGGERTQYDEDNAYELMNLYMGKGADDGKDSFWRELQKDYGPLLILGLAVGGFVVLGVIVVAIKALIEHISYGKGHRSSISTSSVRDDDIVINRTQKEIDEIDDMEIAKQVIQNIGGTDGI